MTNQRAAKLVADIRAGVDVPRKTRQMLIGFLQNVRNKHKDAQRYVELNKVQKIIDELKSHDQRR